EFQKALSAANMTAQELHDQLLWQLTILRFIDVRFRPGVEVAEADIEKYSKEHAAELKNAESESNESQDQRSRIEETIAAEQVNQNMSCNCGMKAALNPWPFAKFRSTFSSQIVHGFNVLPANTPGVQPLSGSARLRHLPGELFFDELRWRMPAHRQP